jgi:hypothetical protein
MDNASAIKTNRMEMIISKQSTLQDTEDNKEDSNSTDNNKEEETDQKLERAQEQAQILNDNMNRAMANLQLSSSNGEDTTASEDTEDDEDLSYMTADDSESSPTAYEINAKDYDDAQEVSLGKFDSIHANKYQEPKYFKQQLWNKAGPTIDSMMVQLTLIKYNLEDNEAGMPFEWMGVSEELHTFLDDKTRWEISDQLTNTNDMLVEMYQMNPIRVRNFDPLKDKLDEEQNTSKTQETPPRAQKARPTEEAATPDMREGRDKEGVQSLGMASGD